MLLAASLVFPLFLAHSLVFRTTAEYSAPVILKQPPNDVILFKVNLPRNEFDIECEAKGEPSPRSVFFMPNYIFSPLQCCVFYSVTRGKRTVHRSTSKITAKESRKYLVMERSSSKDPGMTTLVRVSFDSCLMPLIGTPGSSFVDIISHGWALLLQSSFFPTKLFTKVQGI
jgi:hypothetical protein